MPKGLQNKNVLYIFLHIGSTPLIQCEKTSNLVDNDFPKCYNIINATHATTQRINYYVTKRTHVSKRPCFVNDDDHIGANDIKDTHG